MSSPAPILLTTHYLDEAEQLCDRVAIVHEDRIVALDSPAALLGRLGRGIVEVRVDGETTDALTTLRANRVAGEDAFAVGSTVHIPLHDRSGRDAVAAIADLGMTARSITSRPPTLDDVYLQHTGTSLAA